MSGRLLLKHSTGLVVKYFQRTPGRSPTSVIVWSASLNYRPHTPASALVSYRSFSVNRDKDTATEPIEENEEILRIREREARKDEAYKTETSETETGSTLEEPEDFRDNVQASSEVIPSPSQESQQQQLDSDSDTEEAFPLPPTPSLSKETSRKAMPQKNRENESIVEKLRKLSMLDISRHSEAEMDHDPEKKKDPPKYFDAKLIKVLNMKNRLKSRGDRDDDYGYRNNNYGRPNFNNRRGVYDEDEDDYGSRGQSQRYSKGGYGGSSYGSNYNRQRNPRRNQFDDYGDDHYSDDGEGDVDFDPSRRPKRSYDSNSSRLQEQAQLRRGGAGMQRGLQQDDDEDDDENRMTTTKTL